MIGPPTICETNAQNRRNKKNVPKIEYFVKKRGDQWQTEQSRGADLCIQLDIACVHKNRKGNHIVAVSTRGFPFYFNSFTIFFKIFTSWYGMHICSGYILRDHCRVNALALSRVCAPLSSWFREWIPRVCNELDCYLSLDVGFFWLTYAYYILEILRWMMTVYPPTVLTNFRAETWKCIISPWIVFILELVFSHPQKNM